MNLIDYGFTPNMQLKNDNGIPARVTAVHKGRYALVCEQGELFGRLKAGVYYGGAPADFPTTGDFVQIVCVPGGDSQITATLPRKTFFTRRDPSPGRGEQAAAANFDVVLILQSLNQNFNPKRLERYLTLSWQSGATPAVVFTKADLAADPSAYLRAAEPVCIGVDIFVVSAKTGQGLEALSRCLSPRKTAVLLGSSGVGKSSLVNALAGKPLMAVQPIREQDGRGRHTTSRRQLFLLKNGAMVIDTPGMRELGMWHAEEGLGGAFAEVEQYLGQCKFSDCCHQSEPGCAIRAAIASGALSPTRWESYAALQRENAYTSDKAAYLKEKRRGLRAFHSRSAR